MRLVTLNTWKGDGAYRRRLEAMAACLSRLKPDLIALQEVLQAPTLGLDTADFLARALCMDSVVLPLRRKVRAIEGEEAECWSGLAVLSRRPIRSSRSIALPADPADGERAALLADIDSFTCASLHLTHLQGRDDLRREQLTRTLSAMTGTQAALVAGDFNADVRDLPVQEHGFVDCRHHLGLPPASTLIGGRDSECIDHVLCRGFEPLRWWVEPTRTEPAPSDHHPVVAEFA